MKRTVSILLCLVFSTLLLTSCSADYELNAEQIGKIIKNQYNDAIYVSIQDFVDAPELKQQDIAYCAAMEVRSQLYRKSKTELLSEMEYDPEGSYDTGLVAGSLAHWFGPEYLEKHPGTTANMLSLIDYTVKTLRDAKS